MKLLAWIVSIIFIGVGILGICVGTIEWLEIPFMRGLLVIIAGFLFMRLGIGLLND